MKRLLAIALLVAGCASAPKPQTTPTWTRDGATPQMLAVDRYECRIRAAEASRDTSVASPRVAFAVLAAMSDRQRREDDLFSACMEARGWALK